MEVVKIDHLEKTFGKFRALNDVSFTVNSGESLGNIDTNRLNFENDRNGHSK